LLVGPGGGETESGVAGAESGVAGAESGAAGAKLAGVAGVAGPDADGVGAGTGMGTTAAAAGREPAGLLLALLGADSALSGESNEQIRIAVPTIVRSSTRRA